MTGFEICFRELLQRALQELIDTELTTQIGAGPHERTETLTGRSELMRHALWASNEQTY